MERATRSQRKLTTSETPGCPAEQALRSIGGKWKPRILRLALDAPVRFNALLRDLPESNKQAIATALRELENDGLMVRQVVRPKPLHVEYSLTDHGRSIVTALRSMEA